jgi:hypothetical protein
MNMAEKAKKPGFFSRYIGGLLGEDAESMTPDERRRATLSLLGSIGRNYLSPGSGDESLAAMRASRAAERKAVDDARRTSAAEALMPQVVGRLFGGSAGRLESLPGGEGGELSSRYRQDPRGAMAALYGSQAGRDLGQMAPDLAKLATEGTLGRTVGGSVYNPLTGGFTAPPKAPEPKIPERTVDLGGQVIVYFNDGTSQAFPKGMAPGARARGGGGGAPQATTPGALPAAGAAPAVPGFSFPQGDFPKLTEGEEKSRFYTTTMVSSLPVMAEVLRSGYKPTQRDKAAAGPPSEGVLGGLSNTLVPRSFATPEGRRFYTEGRKVLAAILRKESGAAITDDEWTNYGPMYLPWPGDTEEDIKLKMQSLDQQILNMAMGSGKAFQYFTPPPPSVISREPNQDGIIDLPSPTRRR